MCLNQKLTYTLTKYFIIFIIPLVISGCQTTDIHRVETEEITHKNNYKIVNVIMKNGDTLNLRNSSPQFLRTYEDKKNVILFTASDTNKITEDSAMVSYKKNIIELDKIQAVTIEKTSFHFGETVLFVISVMLGIFVAFMFLITNSDLSH